MSGSRNDVDDTTNRVSSLCGYLWKLKRCHQKIIIVPQWNKRWFSIEGRLLKWYTVASSDHSSGMVDLRFVTDVSIFQAQGVFSFVLSYPDRNILLRASNLSDMNKWIRALQFQADVARGGCGMTIVTAFNTSGSNPQGKGRAVKEKYRPPTLEANLEATMVRLQILESDVLKQTHNERGRGLLREKSGIDRGETVNHLRPEDVRLFEANKEKEKDGEISKRRAPKEKRDPSTDRSRERERDYDSGINRVDNNNNYSGDNNRPQDRKRNDDKDRRSYNYGEREGDRDRDSDRSSSRECHSSGLQKSSDGRERAVQASEDKKSDSWAPCGTEKDRENKRDYALSGKGRNLGRERERGKDTEMSHSTKGRNMNDSEIGRDKKMEKDSKAFPCEDQEHEHIEEIISVPRTRNSARSRGQVHGHRDREREREMDRENSMDKELFTDMDYNPTSSSSSSSRSANSKQNKSNPNPNPNPNHVTRGNMPPSVRQNSWSYDDEATYKDTTDFEGGISRRQNMALTIAAGRVSGPSTISNGNSYRSDHGESAHTSRRGSLIDQGQEFEDLPEMDLTVRRSKQRAARERRQDREREQSNPSGGDRDRDSRITNGNGWV